MSSKKNSVDRYNEAVRDLNFFAAVGVFIMASPWLLVGAVFLVGAIVMAFAGFFFSFSMAFESDLSDALFLCFVGIVLLVGAVILVVGIFFNRPIEEWRARRRLEKEGATDRPVGKGGLSDDFWEI